MTNSSDEPGVKPACAALEVLNRATAAPPDARPGDTLCSERFVDRSPAEVVATLLDEEVYLCTMYRVLASEVRVQEARVDGHGAEPGVPRIFRYLSQLTPNEVQ